MFMTTVCFQTAWVALKRLGSILVLACLGGLYSYTVAGQTMPLETPNVDSPSLENATGIIVHPQFGGEILGYDIDQDGSEGLLSEAVTLGIGQYHVATETFDQATGQIIKVIGNENKTGTDDFVTQGIFFNHAGLDLFQHNGQNLFLKIAPLNQNAFSGQWTPPIQNDYLLWAISVNQRSANVAALEVTFDGNPISYIFRSDISTNTFGPLVSLGPISRDFQFPLVAYDPKTDQGVLAQTGICASCTPHIALVNLTTGKMGEMLGIGVGSAEGLAVDPATGIACTTTTIDQNVEFYNLVNKTSFLVHLPGASSEIQSGQDVELDALHHIFLVQQYTSTGNINDPQPRIYVYDEQGNLVETVAGLQRIPISPVRIALNPKRRIGFVPVVINELVTELQSFSY
jgi:hypothetical protein